MDVGYFVKQQVFGREERNDEGGRGYFIWSAAINTACYQAPPAPLSLLEEMLLFPAQKF